MAVAVAENDHMFKLPRIRMLNPHGAAVRIVECTRASELNRIPWDKLGTDTVGYVCRMGVFYFDHRVGAMGRVGTRRSAALWRRAAVLIVEPKHFSTSFREI
jgi:hypothetical protein